MPEKLNFTKAALSKLPIPTDGKPAVYRDQQVSGLIVMVHPSNRKVFYLSKKVQGKSEKIMLGKYPDLSIENARAKANEHLASIAQGHNPQDTRRAYNNETTFKELFVWYIAYSKKYKKAATVENDERWNRLYLEDWQNKKLSHLSKQEIQSRHAKIGENSQFTANRIVNMVRAMFNKAIELDKWKGANPAIGIKLYKEISRERFLSTEELKRFLKALASEANLTARDFIMLSLLTGARKSNVRSMSWEQLQLEGKEPTWTIPVTKNGRPQTIPLAPQAVEILKQRKRDNKGKYVFAGEGKSGHIYDPRKAFLRILKEAEITNLRLHDLRRTMGSWLAASGANQYIIGKTLGHKSAASTAVYARLNIEPVRQSVNLVVDAMLKPTREYK